MPQYNRKFQIVKFSGMVSGDYVPILAPFTGVTKVVIKNTDGAASISIATMSDSPADFDTIAPNSSQTIDLNTVYPHAGVQPFNAGEIIAAVKGSGAQPTIHFYGGLTK